MSARHVGYRRPKILKSTVKTDSRRELKIVHYGYPSGLEYGVWSQNSGINDWFMLSGVYRVMDARRKFGERERSVRVARGVAKSNSSFLSALQISQVHP